MSAPSFLFSQMFERIFSLFPLNRAITPLVPIGVWMDYAYTQYGERRTQMKNILFSIIISLLLIGTANAGDIAKIYADIDAKIMASNVNVYRYYSPDAIIVEADTGSFQTVYSARSQMQKAIRKGIKVERYKSDISGVREIYSGSTNTICAVVVFSKDYSKLTGDDPKKAGQKITIEQVAVTTRVFNTINPQKWLIISEHSSLIRNETKINGKPAFN